jgi:hypothetical protein
MPTRWYQHLDQTDTESLDSFKNSIRNSSTCLKRLSTILFEDLNALTGNELLLKDFEDPSWSHKQAYRNGFKAALIDQLRLIEGVLNSDH